MEKTMRKYTFPYVTMEQAVNFDPAKPETATESRLVNAVVEAIRTLRPLTPGNIAKHLGLTGPEIAGGMKCATGLSLAKFLDEWRKQKLLHLTAEERMMRSDEIAHMLGFYDRTTLWDFMKRCKLIRCIRKGGWRDPSLYTNNIFDSKKHRT